MAKKLKKGLYAILAVLICVSTVSTVALANETTVWNGKNVSMPIAAGKDGMVVGDPYSVRSSMSDSLNGKNDWAGAARTKVLTATCSV